MKLSTELRNLPIVSITEGEEVGVVKDLIVDPATKSVVAIVVEDPEWYDGVKVISFSLIHSIGDFAITTENVSSVVPLSNMPELAQLLRKRITVTGAKIITRGGRFIGTVKEYSIDARTGDILGLELSGDTDIVSPDRNIIPASGMVTIGKDVIIVNEDVETSLKGSHSEVAGDAVAAPRPRPAVQAAAPRPAPAPAPRPAAPAPAAAAPVERGGGIDSDEDIDIEELLDLDASGPVPPPVAEQRPAAKPAAFDAPAAAPVGKESLSEIFERRQVKYMLGKTVSRDLESDDGALIASRGDIITDDIIARAKGAGKFLELSMNIEIED